jgi:hypothetical protein
MEALQKFGSDCHLLANLEGQEKFTWLCAARQLPCFGGDAAE